MNERISNHPNESSMLVLICQLDARPELPPYSSQSQVTHNASTLHYYQLKERLRNIMQATKIQAKAKNYNEKRKSY
jgi:hypothetical protein